MTDREAGEDFREFREADLSPEAQRAGKFAVALTKAAEADLGFTATVLAGYVGEEVVLNADTVQVWNVGWRDIDSNVSDCPGAQVTLVRDDNERLYYVNVEAAADGELAVKVEEDFVNPPDGPDPTTPAGARLKALALKMLKSF